MKKRDLILLRGLPGSGKSTMAKVLGGVHIEADMFFGRTGEYKFDPTKLKEAHAWCHGQTQQAMLDHEPLIVVSNTFTQEWEMRSYFGLARIHSYQIHTLIVENRHGGENVHGCPKDKVDLMKERFEICL